MVFCPNQVSLSSPQSVASTTVQAESPACVPAQVVGVSYPAEVTQPSAAHHKKLARQDPGRISTATQRARQDALRTLNGLRIVAPALRVACANTSSQEDQVAAFTAMMANANAFAVSTCPSIGMDPSKETDRWAVGMLERAFIEAGAPQQLSTQSAQSLRTLAIASAKTVAMDGFTPDPDETAASALRIGLVRGMGKVCAAHQRFDFLRNDADDDMATSAQHLVDQACAIVASRVNALAPASERRSLMLALVEEGGEIMAQCWDQEAALAIRAMKGRTREAIATWRHANPNGLPLTPVFDRFRRQMARLSKLLATPRPR